MFATLRSALGLGLGISALGLVMACQPADDADVSTIDSVEPNGCNPLTGAGCTTSSGGIALPPPPPPSTPKPGDKDYVPILHHCAGVVPSTYYNTTGMLGNTRVSPVVDGRVACIHIEKNEPTTCKWTTTSGMYFASKNGWFAQAGQPIGLEPGDDPVFVVASPVTTAKTKAGVRYTVPCVYSSGKDTAGTPAGAELAGACTRETLNSTLNSTYGVQNDNFATMEVCGLKDSNTDANPAEAREKAPGIFCYKGEGAGLNDMHGTERDSTDTYLPGPERCHVAFSGGYEVIAAKRPATTSSWPLKINEKTAVSWRAVASIPIANP